MWPVFVRRLRIGSTVAAPNPIAVALACPQCPATGENHIVRHDRTRKGRDPFRHDLRRFSAGGSLARMREPASKSDMPGSIGPYYEFSPVDSATMSLRRPWQRTTPPSFDIGSVDGSTTAAIVAYILDDPVEVNQEPTELGSYGPDLLFDSRGFAAELGIEDDRVVVKHWSDQPNLDRFDRFLRAAAPVYLPDVDVSGLKTSELRDRLEPMLRQKQREAALFWPIEDFVRRVWRRLPWPTK